MNEIFMKVIVGLGLAFILTACAEAEEANQQVGSAKESSQNEIVEIENGDQILTISEVPERAVTLNQHVTEVMLALGLEDHMIGTAYLDDEVLPEWREAYESIPVLAEQYPSQEVFLDAEPDFAYAGWSSAFNEEAIGSIDQLKSYGINAYLHQSSTKVGPALDDIYMDIRHIAKIFNVVERGEDLIRELDNEIEQIKEQIPSDQPKKRVFVYDSGETAAFTVGQNFLNQLITMAGAENIFSDLDKNWAEVSFEEVVQRDPEVIIIIDYDETSVEQKRQQLMTHPALTGITAIQEENFIVLPLSSAAEGVRVAKALEVIVEGLY
ncbi:ABC transporter substrate-binding protein [Alkalihalophilus marmarensis]|uniref:ABC transporter substrate-binding protein n=1 Tax=Alkalihalophilus marmarensis TaxID=521377 RepID=UPI002DB879B6|nr:ABC transporter substrate-binding protein [Alkalihalophilus marmarensis]MEC2072254.1 ABC transporter substrate-binding protein [Alkalihalophilus marmarensis]